jgi:hypothetical protein
MLCGVAATCRTERAASDEAADKELLTIFEAASMQPR